MTFRACIAAGCVALGAAAAASSQTASPPKAYLVVRVQVTDDAAYAAYREIAPAIVEQYGGRYLARGGRTTTLEGPEEKRRIVVLEFPDFDRAVTFYRSAEYQAAVKKRAGAAQAEFVLVEGR